MKALLSISILIVLFWLIACNSKEEPMPNPEVFGTATCDFGDVKWYGVVTSIPQKKLDAPIHSMEVFKSTTGDQISFTSFKLEVGKYSVYHHQTSTTGSRIISYLFRGTGDAALIGYYDLIEVDTFENYFEITDVNLDTKEIVGNFQAAYLNHQAYEASIDSSLIVYDTVFIQPDSFILVYPDALRDTLFIRNGIFKTFLKD